MFYKGYYENLWPKIFFVFFFIFVRLNSHKVVVFCGWYLIHTSGEYTLFLRNISDLNRAQILTTCKSKCFLRVSYFSTN